MDPERLLPSQDAAPAADDSAELELLVRRSDEDVALFDSQRIVEALTREAQLDPERARQISQEIKRFIERIGIRTLSSSLIRGLVDTKLLEYGLEDAHRAHTRLGVPLFDVDRLMHNARPAAAQPLGPEGTSLMLAEAIKREYAIMSVLSEPVANAHLVGDIHIQDLGSIDRPYSIATSVDYIKQYGIALPQGFASSAPARRPEVLVAHLVKFSAALQGYLSGPVVWDSLNFALAPYVEALEERDLRQLAQTLLFEFSAPAVARAGQPIVCDVHLDWDAPAYMRDRQAIGPGGAAINRTYGEYTETAHRVLRAMFEAYLAGDANGRAFLTPRPILHITRRFNEQPGYRGMLDLASRVATERGGLVFVFDRDDAASFFNRYGLSDERAVERSESADWRSAALQVVALNLPRVAYLAAGDHVRAFEELTRLMEAAAQAHLEKRVFIEKLLAQGEQGPLSLIARRGAAKPFLRLAWMTHWISPVGLNEMTRAVLGSELHADADAVEFASRVVGHLRREAERLSSKHKVRFVLSEACSPGIPHRLARLDLRFFGRSAAEVVRGTPETGSVYYTTGFRLAASAETSLLDRLRAEGHFHTHGVLNASTELWFDERVPSAEQAAIAVSQAFYQSDASALALVPVFTICFACGASSRGLRSECPACQSSRVDGFALSGDRYAPTSGWDDGQLAELGERHRAAV
jgi:ribonucleoside-triphosphate reductase